MHLRRRRLRATVCLAGAVVTMAMTVRADDQAAGPPAAGQAAPSAPLAPGTGLIVGHAIDAASGKPLSGVIVMLLGPSPDHVLVDRNGGFVFSELRRGTYSIMAQKPGYADGAYGRRLPGGSTLNIDVADDERVTDVTIRLWKFAAVSGTVLDEAGEPVVGVEVRALKKLFIAGHRRFDSYATATTDDRGAYRLTPLTFGDYVVVVPSTTTTLPGDVMDQYNSDRNGSNPLAQAIFGATSYIAVPGSVDQKRVGEFVVQGAQRSAVTPEPRDDGRLAVYPTVFYPDASGAAEATTISVESGEERTGVDVHLRAVPTQRLSGTVTGPDGPVALMPLRLVPQSVDDLGGETGFETATTLTDYKGAFTFLGVPGGSYVLRALKVPPVRALSPNMQAEAAAVGGGRGAPGPMPISDEPTLWADQPVAVAHEDVTMAVTLNTGLRISGKYQFDGTKPLPNAQQMRQIPVSIEPVDGRSGGRVSIPPGHAEPDGTFRTYGLPAGKYLIRIGGSPPGWTFKAAMFQGKDRSETPIEVRSGDVMDVVVIFTETPAQIAGTVQPHNASDPETFVVMFPTDPAGWTDFGVNTRRVRGTRPSRTGAYAFPNPPAGDYFLIAIIAETAVDWREPKFLEALSRFATRVHVTDGEKTSQDLETKVIR